ncbi:class I SAM-dependent methyltransferase [Flavobacteriales bacterium]|nr:class I SAM-dependent methyltransferase [Flavobacteriales bacterium]|tara:strand:- start:1005 stop:1592 length:588 start_codon:yes stop_codon:yes gene_type:complete
MNSTFSDEDRQYLQMGRNHLNNFVNKAAAEIPIKKGRLLEIGAQGRSEVQVAFNGFDIQSFDIVNTHNPDFLGDLTTHNPEIPNQTFDVIACLEVLEHTLQPFDAVAELRRMLRDGGYLIISAPLNFRIHGPIPDCWRFTEFGWRVLLKNFDILKIDELKAPSRPLFPIKYNILAQCNHAKQIRAQDLVFSPVKM